VAALLLAARGGARYAGSAPRLFTAAGEHREQLRNDLALQTAEDVAATLGTMKGVLMKLGQMASYIHDGLSPAARRTLASLQDSVPPIGPVRARHRFHRASCMSASILSFAVAAMITLLAGALARLVRR
jgi:predicted unusual protein kinase regulating ubiquinone biosynthesis (AarF/ABC1/UbiB family)